MRVVTFLLPVLMVVASPAFAASEAEPAVAIAYAHQVSPNLLTGGQPTPEDLELAKAQGYRTVINLRTPGETGAWDEAAKAKALGMNYVAIPVAGADGLTEANARRLAEALNSPGAGPVLLHCATSNRVGALLALKAGLVDGQNADAAVALGQAAGMTSPKLLKVVRERLESAQESSR